MVGKYEVQQRPGGQDRQRWLMSSRRYLSAEMASGAD